MRVRHPRDRTPSMVSVNGQRVDVDEDGTFELPEGTSRNWVRTFAEAYDADVEDLLVDTSETCDAVKSDGEVCGRELPCQYHTEAED